MNDVAGAFRRVLAAPLEGETIRALATFVGLFLLVSSITGVLAFRELDLRALSRQLEVARDEAQRLAEAVASLARSERGIDLNRIRQSQRQLSLRKVIDEQLARNPLIRHVEVVDRGGSRILFAARDPRTGLPAGPGLPDRRTVPGTDDNLVRAPIGTASRAEGEVRVSVDPDLLRRQVDGWRASLRRWVAVAATLGTLVLVVSFAYVLYLIRKNKRLEQSKLSAERRSYVGLLASGLAHEIRNPLNAMNMNLQMLEEEIQGMPGLEGSDHLELLASTKSEIKRLERLVNNFLAFARPSQPRFEPRDLNGVLGEVARFLQADFHQNQVELSVDLEPLLPTVEIDETQFKQALMNLMVNARQVLRAGGAVTLRSRALPSGEVLVEVEDDGPGIPPAAREKIFEVFYSNRGGGTGLGLPIARQIVERHGGSIEVDSAEGHGTTFRIRLPRRHERMAPLASTAQASPMG